VAFDVVIRSGWVFDGLGGEPVRGDLGVVGGRIEALGPCVEGEAARTIDASGLAVAPGFIDIHTHGDVYPLLCPDAPARLHDGVTTEMVGNCGESPFPQSRAMLAARADSVERYGIEVDWATLDDFARRQDAAGSGINRCSLVGHGNVRAAVMGEGDGAPTGEQLDGMCREVEAAMEAGAVGLSTGLVYAPGMYAEPREVEALCRVVARYGGLYASHIRNEGETMEEAVEEFADAGRHTGVRLQLSHVKMAGEPNWGKAQPLARRLEAIRAEGVDLACDRYPYTAGATSLSAFLPGWAREGGRERMLERVAGGETRRRLLVELGAEEMQATWRVLVIAGAGCERWQQAEGRGLVDVAAEVGRPPAEVALEVLTASGGRASIVQFSMCERNVAMWLRLPFVAVASDSSSRGAEGPTASGKPHPRAYGTSARFLGRYVREQGLMGLAEGVRRLTSLPASRIGLSRRGVLRPGACADVAVFDPQRIIDRATYEHPQQYSVGVRAVLVNGVVALADCELTGARAGRFLRRGEE